MVHRSQSCKESDTTDVAEHAFTAHAWDGPGQAGLIWGPVPRPLRAGQPAPDCLGLLWLASLTSCAPPRFLHTTATRRFLPGPFCRWRLWFPSQQTFQLVSKFRVIRLLGRVPGIFTSLALQMGWGPSCQHRKAPKRVGGGDSVQWINLTQSFSELGVLSEQMFLGL